MNYIKFLKKNLDYYHKKYPEIDCDILSDLIEETLITYPLEFSYEFVQKNQELCVKCGRCCERTMDCSHYDKKTNHCEIWTKRPRICREFPYYNAKNRRGIYLADYCKFAEGLAKIVLDNKIKIYVDDNYDI